MKVALLTREYPPEVYGGAGVHVEYLARELARLEDVSVHAWGARPRRRGRPPAWDALAGDAPHLAALRAMSIDLSMTAGVEGAEVVHSPHLVRAPRRPPGEAHLRHPARGDRALARAAAAVEGRAARRRLRAVELVREGRARGRRRGDRGLGGDARATSSPAYPAIDPERVQVIYNGIDAERVHARPGHRRARELRRRPRPAVGRVRRADHAPEGRAVPASTRRCSSTRAAQLVLCAGAPDTPEIAAEVERRRRAAAGRARRT